VFSLLSEGVDIRTTQSFPSPPDDETSHSH